MRLLRASYWIKRAVICFIEDAHYINI
ncbi:hypothetical protein EMIT0P171_40357 [Pseudomonas sp. IT-P171]